MSSAADRVLVVGPSWVGDMVMSQALYIHLERTRPGVLIDVLAPAWSEPILARMPQVREAVPLPIGHGETALGRRRRIGRQLRPRHYGQAILLPNSFKSALIPFFARIPRRTGWRGEMRYGLHRRYMGHDSEFTFEIDKLTGFRRGAVSSLFVARGTPGRALRLEFAERGQLELHSRAVAFCSPQTAYTFCSGL